MTVIEKAHAKINLSLEVVGRRADGYHELISVMQSVSLADELKFTRITGDDIALKTDADVPLDESNLIHRAAKAYFKAAGLRFGVAVTLNKSIPLQAGMGGGSSDAAATLRALNKLDGDRFTPQQLCNIGVSVGADVPFCVLGGTRLCRGIGEQTEGLENRLRCHVVIAMQGEGVSTPLAFARLDESLWGDRALAEAAELRADAMASALKNGELEVLAAHARNHFEQVILPQHPYVACIKRALLANGAALAQMSGSGPCVFGLFSQADAAKQAALSLQQSGAQAFLCSFAL